MYIRVLKELLLPFSYCTIWNEKEFHIYAKYRCLYDIGFKEIDIQLQYECYILIGTIVGHWCNQKYMRTLTRAVYNNGGQSKTALNFLLPCWMNDKNVDISASAITLAQYDNDAWPLWKPIVWRCCYKQFGMSSEVS